MTTASEWLGLWLDFGNPYTEVILSCEVPITLNIIWYSAAKLQIGGVSSSQEIYVKDGKGAK